MANTMKLFVICSFIVVVRPDIDSECTNESPCVRFCCLSNPENCTDEHTGNSSIIGFLGEENVAKNFKKLYGTACSVVRKLEENETYTFLKSGSIKEINSGAIYTPHEYCIHRKNDTTRIYPCVIDDSQDQEQIDDSNEEHLPYLMIVSIPFLVVTYVVYAYFKELRNLHGKCLMSYTLSLLIFYLSFAILRILHEDVVTSYKGFCISLGYLIYAFALSCFFWLNVMSYDIFMAFRRGMRQRRSDFIQYCCYAFGCPFALTSFAYLIDAFYDSSEIKIGIIGDTCWIQDKFAMLFYLYVPIATILITNTILFSLTAYKIYQVQKETSIVQHGDSCRHSKEADTARFWLYLRLFIISGCVWCTEVLSFFIGNSNFLTQMLDVMNCLQGVIVFFLFVWKPKIRKILKERIQGVDRSQIKGQHRAISGTESVAVYTSATQESKMQVLSK